MRRTQRAQGVRLAGTGIVVPTMPKIVAGGPDSAKTGQAEALVPPALLRLSERDFQAIVTSGLRQRGYTVWHVQDSRLMAAGLPDILAYHPRRPGLLLAYELKRQAGGRIRPAQAAALAHLRTVPGLDVRIVRPSDWFAMTEDDLDRV